MMMTRYAECPHLPALLAKYPRDPSFALIRTPEIEYLRKIDFARPSLDHCCGDGFFASLVSLDGFDAGVDFSKPALDAASRVHRRDGEGPLYGDLKRSDVSKEIPWPNETFAFVLNNSGLEHIDGLEGALQEISRVLRPGGRFVFTLLGKRAIDWWPPDLEDGSRETYLERQPMRNLLSLDEWRVRLANHGLRLVDFESHFDREENEFNLRYDYLHSMAYLAGRPLPGWLTFLHRRSWLSRVYFGRTIRRRTYHSYPNEDAGAMYCFTTVKES
ncbi:class I SAM-dependent methyltransferase [Candidatus Sumerlaeota bacterium]|nr:class I SAM-dependent methyltransferase [Candidatus Sumerlaeota bacterium]